MIVIFLYNFNAISISFKVKLEQKGHAEPQVQGVHAAKKAHQVCQVNVMRCQVVKDDQEDQDLKAYLDLTENLV